MHFYTTSRIIFIFIIFISSGFSSLKKIDWKEGMVIFKSQDFHQGYLYFDVATNLVLIKKDGFVLTYPASKVEKFQYFDDELNVNRKFISVEKLKVNYIKESFLEIVLAGFIPLYRKEKAIHYPVSHLEYNKDKFGHKENFKYYANVDGQLIDLSYFKKKLLPHIAGENEIKYFIKRNQLDVKNLGHQIMIIDLFNKISGEKLANNH